MHIYGRCKNHSVVTFSQQPHNLKLQRWSVSDFGMPTTRGWERKWALLPLLVEENHL